MDKLGVLCKVIVSETGLVGGHDSPILQKPAEPGIDQGAADVSIAPWQQRSRTTVREDYWKPMKIVH